MENRTPGSLGTPTNPIRCDSPDGERRYLARLRLLNGKDISWRRVASTGRSPDGYIMDMYKSSKGDILYLDMYHKGYSENQAPEGYRLFVQWSDKYEYKNGLIHKWNEDYVFTGTLTEQFGKETYSLAVNNGIIDGSIKMLYKNGSSKCETPYNKTNKKHGTEKWFYNDGSTWAEVNYQDGQYHGVYRYFEKDGSIRYESNYEKGTLIEDKASQ